MEDGFAGLRSAVADRFEVVSVLGRGGTATVFRALDLDLNRWVALKVMDLNVTSTLGTERFLREISITARLQHPNILPLLDSGEADRFLYLVTPLVEGRTLRELLAAQERLDPRHATLMALEIADALAYAHANGVVHLDIKPGNILVSDGHAMVADFGIAHALAESGDVIGLPEGLPVGTPEYMSPEQVSGYEDVDVRSDVYGLGCVLFEMLTGKVPFQGVSAVMIMSQHLNAEPPSARAAGVRVSPELERVIIRALAKNRESRYASAAAMAGSLEAALERRRSRPGALSSTIGGLSATAMLALGWWGLSALSAGEPPRLADQVQPPADIEFAAPAPQAEDGSAKVSPPRAC